MSGSKDGGKDIQWKKDGKSEDGQVGGRRKPKMLLRVPAHETYKRVWHFLKIFPMKNLEYCANVWIGLKYDEGTVPKFNGIAFFAA